MHDIIISVLLTVTVKEKKDDPFDEVAQPLFFDPLEQLGGREKLVGFFASVNQAAQDESKPEFPSKLPKPLSDAMGSYFNTNQTQQRKFLQKVSDINLFSIDFQTTAIPCNNEGVIDTVVSRPFSKNTVNPFVNLFQYLAMVLVSETEYATGNLDNLTDNNRKIFQLLQSVVRMKIAHPSCSTFDLNCSLFSSIKYDYDRNFGPYKQTPGYRLDVLNIAMHLCMPGKEPYYGLCDGPIMRMSDYSIVDTHNCALYVDQDHALHKTLTKGKPGIIIKYNNNNNLTSQFTQSMLQSMQALTPLLQKIEASLEETNKIRHLATLINPNADQLMIIPHAYAGPQEGRGDFLLYNESLMEQYFEPNSVSIFMDEENYLVPSWFLSMMICFMFASDSDQDTPLELILTKIEQTPSLRRETIPTFMLTNFQESFLQGIFNDVNLETIKTYTTSLQKIVSVIFPKGWLRDFNQVQGYQTSPMLSEEQQEKVKLLGIPDLLDQQEQLQKPDDEQAEPPSSSSSSRKNT